MPDLKISELSKTETPNPLDSFALAPSGGGDTERQTRAQIHSLESGEHLVLPQVSEPATPTLSFGDGDTGFYEHTDNAIRIAVLGTAAYSITGALISCIAVPSPSWELVAETSSSTNPVFAFSSDSDTGMGSAGANSASLIAGGVEALRVNTAVTGVNRLDITPSAAGAGVIIATAGADANIELAISPKGTGATRILSLLETVGPTAGNVGGFAAGNMMVRGEGITEFSSAVITGHSGFNTNTQLWYLGSVSSSNNKIAFINRQNAEISFNTNNSTAMLIKPVASGVNHLAVTPSAIGNPVLLGVEGTDANIDLNLVPKGTGVVRAIGTLQTDVIAERSAAVGVTIDGLLIKDGGLGDLAGVNMVNAAGSAMLDEAATATNPTLAPDKSDPDTGIGHQAANVLSLIAGAVETVRISTAQVLAVNGSVSLPAYGFVADVDTGVFSGGGDVLALAAGGVEGIRLTEASGGIVRGSQMTSGITAGTTQTQAGATQLNSSYNRVDTVAVINDGVKMPAAVAGRVVFIQNSGANNLLLYPTVGDNFQSKATDASVVMGIGASSFRILLAIDNTEWIEILDGSGAV